MPAATLWLRFVVARESDTFCRPIADGFVSIWIIHELPEADVRKVCMASTRGEGEVSTICLEMDAVCSSCIGNGMPQTALPCDDFAGL